MADAKKKKSEPKKNALRDTRGGKSAPSVTKAIVSDEVAAVESGKVHSPWIPLVWILVPLVACVVYGFVTRSSGH